MKKGLFLLGLTACAAIVGTVTYLYRTDSEVREQVDAAAAGLRDVYREVGSRVRDRKVAAAENYQAEVAKNQAWADQQWEALGI